tara:strand:- start:346 stop:1032 length:687 start_codon:yes stop_codon:yes gene_type:complete
MPLNKPKTLRTKNIFMILQSILLTSFVSTVFASPSCHELVAPLIKTNDSIALNGGLWGYFEKDPFLRKYSTQAVQLDSRINKVFFLLNYLCETKNGIPFNDLATYISRSIANKGEPAFKEELIILGKTSKQINNWFNFFMFAQSHRFRTLNSSTIRATINKAIPLINNYVSLEKNINQSIQSKVILKNTGALRIKIDRFFSSDPYITQALDEISHVPYWDINESTGGS